MRGQLKGPEQSKYTGCITKLYQAEKHAHGQVALITLRSVLTFTQKRPPWKAHKQNLNSQRAFKSNKKLPLLSLYRAGFKVSAAQGPYIRGARGPINFSALFATFCPKNFVPFASLYQSKYVFGIVEDHPHWYSGQHDVLAKLYYQLDYLYIYVSIVFLSSRTPSLSTKLQLPEFPKHRALLMLKPQILCFLQTLNYSINWGGIVQI